MAIFQSPDAFSDAQILALRPAKNSVDPWRPYAFLVEDECTEYGAVESVATVFLTNKECPFRCLMCDLWKNTIDETVPRGAIPAQIEWALAQLPPAQHIKLYNSGNFFDTKAIPQQDFPGIADLIAPFKTAIVECHPKLVRKSMLDFKNMIAPKLEVAMGLETIHPQVLARLNKRMTLDDFRRASGFLRENEMTIRAFILVKPPFLDEAEGIEWAKRSIDFAFDAGVSCCAIIPTRVGNGAMEVLQKNGHFVLPKLASLEKVLDYGIRQQRGRVIADLWDIEQFADCDDCIAERKKRIHRINLYQQELPEIECQHCKNS